MITERPWTAGYRATWLMAQLATIPDWPLCQAHLASHIFGAPTYTARALDECARTYTDTPAGRLSRVRIRLHYYVGDFRRYEP